MNASAPTRSGLCLYRAERAYVDASGTGHDVVHLYATGHTTSGTPMDDGDWPTGLELWDLLDTDEHGRTLVDPVPFQEQWRAGPVRVLVLAPGDAPPESGVMAQEELHVACEEGCTEPGAEARQSLAELRAALHRAGALKSELTMAHGQLDQLVAEVQDLLAEDLRRDLNQ